MDRAQDFDLATAAHAALVGRTPPSQWDERLRAAGLEQMHAAHSREADFLLKLGMVIAVLSLLIDWIAIPQHLAEVALIRLLGVIPLSLVALALPTRLLGLKKLLMAVSMTAFACSLAYASQFAPAPSNALLALGVITLLALGLPVLPFRRFEVVSFVIFYLAAVGACVWVFENEVARAEAFFPIAILATAAAGVLSHRVHWLERRDILLTLEADYRAAALEDSNEQLTALSLEDPLTGLANRRHAETVFDAHYALPSAPGQARAALLMLDLDRFKAFNDRFGHQTGDACLRAVAEAMRHTASRHGGLAARFGGEEFVILLRADDDAQALAIAEDLRVAIERIEIAHDAAGTTATCTTSIGVAVQDSADAPTLKAMLAWADAALYRAKAEGRNRCVAAG
ncbi:GGDEF domain-containing protein [Qipengyuania flava]|uniref:GGDEF domain-containing protein n=1 Tax=Qipengyuania flava TaxID=192812 RepID=UPI001C62FFBD|nr:GGDEF domain-containing protein [Qipengyuania flava]QYJ07554.1 GGDEF domain-containing protein [Qipengyuania flava]